MFAVPSRPPFSETDLRAAIDQAECWSDALRLLGYQPKGHNYRTLKRYVSAWNISTAHFDPNAGRRRAGPTQRTPLEDVLVQNSTYPRSKLKGRLLTEGLIAPRCEFCGQDEIWRGKRMSLVLDHINGVSNDNRLANLRMVCPNCAATLDTHCGRNLPQQRACPGCGERFVPNNHLHRYCSMKCWGSVAKQLYRGIPHHDRRKVERPSHEQLLADLESMSYCAVGRKYGVSDNAVRKWLRWYEREQERKEGGDDLSLAA
jgi:transposase-like protein